MCQNGLTFLFQVPREVEGSRVASDGRRGEDDAQARQRGQGRTGKVQGSNSPTFLQAAFEQIFFLPKNYKAKL